MYFRNHFFTAPAIFLVLVIGGSAVYFTASTDGKVWQQPIPIPDRSPQFIDYQSLQKTGDVRYYRLHISQPTTTRIELSIPRSVSRKFVPQLVIFEPSDVTIGPILPFDQPLLTLAQVYPATQPRQVVNAFTQTLSTVRLEAQPELTAPGSYILAVYNAGSSAGHVKLTVDRGTSLTQWQDAWLMPVRWWQDQSFAGLSFLTLITPVLIGLTLWFVYLRLDHHQLHPHRKYPVRRGKKTS